MPSGVSKLGWGQLKVRGLVGWGAVRATREISPNGVPFEHLGDLDALSEQLNAALSSVQGLIAPPDPVVGRSPWFWNLARIWHAVKLITWKPTLTRWFGSGRYWI